MTGASPTSSGGQPIRLTAAQAIDLALKQHNQGQHQRSLALCLRLLGNHPHHFTLLYLTALNYGQLGDHAQALVFMLRAAEVQPGHAAILSDIANTLRILGRHQESMDYCLKALALKPDYVDALSNLGNACYMLQRFDEALASYDRALALAPHHVNSLSNRGNVLLELKHPEQALACFRQALAQQPDHLGSLNNLGNALFALHRLEEAANQYRRALAQQPDYPDALNNLGCVLLELAQPEQALVCFDRLLARDPQSEQGLYGRGNCLKQLNRFPETIHCWQQLLNHKPAYPYLRGALFSLRQNCCDWQDYAACEQALLTAVLSGGKAANPFDFLMTTASASQQLYCARQYARQEYPAKPAPLWQGEIYRHERIRIAYLSADYYNHATAYLMAELFARHDQRRFETIAISFGPNPQDVMRQRMEGLFSRFIDVRERSDQEIALLLRELEIDIAVDLKGYTRDSRMGILAYRPAPVQVNYLGYPGTLGADYIDYIIADRHLIPPGHEPYYQEQVVRLPDSYQVNDRQRLVAPDTPSRAQAGLPEQGFVFCSFNNHYKLSPEMFAVWMRLLARVPGSVLWQLCDNAVAIANLQQQAQQHGIDPARLVFAGRLSSPFHLARQRLADLFLDTLPCNAHTTASDALWMGLPLLTCQGETFVGRVASSLLHAAGVPELVTHSLAEYEARALQLATEPARLAALKARLLAQRDRCTLFDTDRYCRHLESAYQTMWRRYQDGAAPTAFDVKLQG